MTDLIVLKLGATPQEPVAWGAFVGATIEEAGRVADVASLSGMANRLPSDARIVAILSGEQVAMREIPAPPKQTSKLMAAARYILEDELAEAVDDLHVVVTTGASRAALAVSKAVMSEWVAAFDAAGVAVSEMTVDYLCIGGTETACIIVGDHGRIIASRGKAGFSAELSLADVVAPPFIEAAGEAAIIAYGAHDPVGRWAHAPVERRPLPHEADVVALFGAHLSIKGAQANFLSGEFRRRQVRSLKLGPWKRPAALAAGLAGVAIVSAAASGLRDGRIASIFEDSASAMHQAAFPTYSAPTSARIPVRCSRTASNPRRSSR